MQTSAVWQFVVPGRDAPIQTASGASLDFNGDGHRDIALWNPAGYVEVRLGGATGPSHTSSGTLRATRGADASVRLAGDVNGDGFSDLLVSVNATSTLFLGSTDVRADIVGLPIAMRDSLRTTAATGVGDVNCDGYGDLATLHDRASGAPDMTEMSVTFGAAMIPAAWIIARSFGPSNWLALGGFVAINEDACTDVEFNRPGGVQLYLGDHVGLPATPASGFNTFSPSSPIMQLAGDVDGNGRTDFIPTVTTALRDSTYQDLYLTPDTLVFSRATQRLDALGPNVVPIGDIDNDGFADCVALTADEFHVHRGTPSGYATTPFATLPRRADESVPVSFGADFNRDGFDDLVVTSPTSLTIYRGAATPPLVALTTIAIPSSTVAF